MQPARRPRIGDVSVVDKDVADGTSTSGYDAENRLISATGGLTLTYDSLGRLFQTAGGASGTTQFLTDGSHLVEGDSSDRLLRRWNRTHPGDAALLIR